jgi:tetratricopeptide (TPR) repeat protein
MARFKLKADLLTEAKFYLSRAQTLIDRMDYHTMRIQLYNAWGDFYQAGQLYSEACNNYQMALALSRRLGNPHDEARSLRNLGLLASCQKDYQEAESRLKNALSIFDRLGAIYEVMSIYNELAFLALGRGDHCKAQEIALYLVNQGRITGYVDLNIRALVALADCEIIKGCPEKAVGNYSKALALAKAHDNAAYSKTVHLLISRIIEYAQESSCRDLLMISQNGPILESLRSKLDGRNYSDLLKMMPDPVELYRVLS